MKNTKVLAPRLLVALERLLAVFVECVDTTDVFSEAANAEFEARTAIAMARNTALPQRSGPFPAECVWCGSASGPLLTVDAECPGWVCPTCYARIGSGDEAGSDFIDDVMANGPQTAKDLLVKLGLAKGGLSPAVHRIQDALDEECRPGHEAENDAQPPMSDFV